MLHPPYCAMRKQWIYLAFLVFYGCSQCHLGGCQTAADVSDGSKDPPDVLLQRVPISEDEGDDEIKKEPISEDNEEPVVLSSANKVTKLSEHFQGDDGSQNGEMGAQLHDEELHQSVGVSSNRILDISNVSLIRSRNPSKRILSLQRVNASHHSDDTAEDATHSSGDHVAMESPMFSTDDQQESSVKVNEQSAFDVQYGSEEDSTIWSATTFSEVSDDPEIMVSAMDSLEEPSEPSEVTYGSVSQTDEMLKRLTKPTSESFASFENRTESENTHDLDADDVIYENATVQSVETQDNENENGNEDLLPVWNSTRLDDSGVLDGVDDELLVTLSDDWPSVTLQVLSPTMSSFRPTLSIQSDAHFSSDIFLDNISLSSPMVSSHASMFPSTPELDVEVSSSGWINLDSLYTMSGLSAFEVTSVRLSTEVTEATSTFVPIVSMLSTNGSFGLRQEDVDESWNETSDMAQLTNGPLERHPQWQQHPVVILQAAVDQADATKSMLNKDETPNEAAVETPLKILDHDEVGHEEDQSDSKGTKNGPGIDKQSDDDAKEEDGFRISVNSSLLFSQELYSRTIDADLSMFNLNATSSEWIVSSPMLMTVTYEVFSSVHLNSTSSGDLVSKYKFSYPNVTFSSPTAVKVAIPIKPTKSSDVTDRWTKYNRLPTDVPSGEKSDASATDSVMKPALSIPTIRIPVAYLSVTMKCTWSYFCRQRLQFQRIFAQELKKAVKLAVSDEQVIFFNVNVCNDLGRARNDSFTSSVDSSTNFDESNSENIPITVPLYVSDGWGIYSKSLTELLGVIIVKNEYDGSIPSNGEHNNITLPNVVLGVQLHRKEDNTKAGQLSDADQESNLGIIIAIIVSCIAGVCLILLFIILVILRRAPKETRAGRCRPATTDAYSLDSVSSIHSSFRRRKMGSSKRSYLNHAFNDPNAPSRKLNFVGLSNASVAEEALAEEFKIIPMQMAKYDEMPPGVEEKNRYANIIPFPETRVILTPKTGGVCDYINANYVRGYRGESKRYIACQAPLESTMTDFWQMVWDNQSKAIIMLTAMVEEGVNRCAPYFAESDTLDSHRLYGDFQVTTQNRDVREDYIISTLQIKNLEKNLIRSVMHFMYTSWPSHEVPSEYANIAKLLVETRPFTRSNAGPMVVHCSPGTGRTGTVLAIDVCMHEFEFTRMVDIPQCVHKLRQDRGGCVQTAEQYVFIYKVLSEHASRIVNHSGRSSVRSVR